MTITRVDGHVSAVIDHDTVIMSADTGRFHVVAATGALIWDMLGTPQTLEQLTSALTARFDVSYAQCRAEVDDFVISLAERGLVIIGRL